ncbi:hypothetical protein LWI28_001812 [Acer negundo]|uniref:Uncharacterized protein n=1 Tax=Acer negundo TaxID=4023 RepID=A0AAD5NL14_ACENE|nr:hypothetical protein LWI28_001812 [Acer negundo]
MLADTNHNFSKNSVSRHFFNPEIWNRSPPNLSRREGILEIMAATQPWEDRDRRLLLVESDLIELGLFSALSRHWRRFGVTVVPPRALKRRPNKENVCRKVAKIVAGTSTSNASHLDLLKDVVKKRVPHTGAGVFSPDEKVNIGDSDEKNDDQVALRDLISRERRSKSIFDLLSTAHPLSFDRAQIDEEPPKDDLLEHHSGHPCKVHKSFGQPYEIPLSARRIAYRSRLAGVDAIGAGSSLVKVDLDVPTWPRKITTKAFPVGFAMEEMTRPLITQDRQAGEISRLKKELTEKDEKLKSTSV